MLKKIFRAAVFALSFANTPAAASGIAVPSIPSTTQNTTAPATPPSGQTSVYVDSTAKVLSAKNDAGIVSHTVQTLSAVAHFFLTAINSDGSETTAQPTCSDISGAAASCSTDATNASNITSGTLAAGRLPSVVPQIICQSGAASSAGADTTEDTLATCTITANAMGSNGCVDVLAYFDFTGNTNAKTFRVRLGNTLEAAPSTSSSGNIALNMWQRICNLNATNSQRGFQNNTGVFGFMGSEFSTSVDTTVNENITITGQKAVAGDTLTLTMYTVKLEARS